MIIYLSKTNVARVGLELLNKQKLAAQEYMNKNGIADFGAAPPFGYRYKGFPCIIGAVLDNKTAQELDTTLDYETTMENLINKGIVRCNEDEVEWFIKAQTLHDSLKIEELRTHLEMALGEHL